MAAVCMLRLVAAMQLVTALRLVAALRLVPKETDPGVVPARVARRRAARIEACRRPSRCSLGI